MKREYMLFDSIAKTVKQNGLHRSEYNKKILLDLSLIDNVDMAEDEKEKLKVHCIKHVYSVTSDFDFYLSELDYFRMISAKLFYKRLSVISSDRCKIAYHIMRLCKIDGSEAERRDVWSEYEAVKIFDLKNESDDAPEEAQISA